MQKTSEQPEFIKTVDEIRGAEEKYDRIINDAKAKADKIMRKAKEAVSEERRKTSEKIVEFKNERLKEGSKDIEAGVQKIVKKAKADGSKASSKKLQPAAVSKLVKGFLTGL